MELDCASGGIGFGGVACGHPSGGRRSGSNGGRGLDVLIGVRAHRAHSSQSRGFIRRCGRIDAPARQPAEPEVHQRQPARQGDRGAQRQALAPIEIFSFCDALAAQKMIEPDVSMLAYMPCRIGIPEDGQGGTWIVAMLIDEAVIQALPAAARESAQYVTGTMQEIVVATARRDL